MLRTILIAALLCAQTATASASTACAGADPAIGSVVVKATSSDGNLNRYELAGTVTNVGSAAQASNVLQFVDIYAGSVKLDAKAIPPLKPGESYAFSYVSTRSRDAGKGTTKLEFRLDPAPQACRAGDTSQTVTF